MSVLQSRCESSCKIVSRGPKMELLKVADGLNTTIVLYHSHGVHSWMPPALSLRGYKDATSIRWTGLDL